MTSTDYELKRQQDERRNMLRRVLLFVVVICVLILVSIYFFNQFKTYSEARLALRETKNIKISLEMIDLEYYSLGLNIYDETADGNIRTSARDYINHLQGDYDGIIRLTGYDSTKRKITGLEYELTDYIVRYTLSEDGEVWQVCKIKEILNY